MGADVISSTANARVKQLRAAFAGHARLSGGLIAIEGDHLLEEALRSGMVLKTVFVSERREAPGMVPRGVEVVRLTGGVFESAVVTESPQGVAALMVPPVWVLQDVVHDGRNAISLLHPNEQRRSSGTPVLHPNEQVRSSGAPVRSMPTSQNRDMGHPEFGGHGPLVLVAAGLQDPGNLGTLVRSAEAFGAAGVLTTPGTVSAWNQKALRASAGSVFRVPVVAVDAAGLEGLKRGGMRLIAAVGSGGAGVAEAAEMDLRGSCAVMIGNEGSGLAAEWMGMCDGRVTIPCPGPVESLNAAVAGSLLLYEASSQRAVRKDPGRESRQE